MKKIILTLLFAAMTLTGAYAQNQKIGFINTETILAGIQEYKDAQATLESLSTQYQNEIQAEYKTIDILYTNYQNQKAYMSNSQRNAAENNIISKEQAVKQKQESYFGQGGEMSKKSEELLQPIRTRVDAAIKAYSEAQGYTIIIDIAAAGYIVYYTPDADITNEIIKTL